MCSTEICGSLSCYEQKPPSEQCIISLSFPVLVAQTCAKAGSDKGVKSAHGVTGGLAPNLHSLTSYKTCSKARFATPNPPASVQGEPCSLSPQGCVGV